MQARLTVIQALIRDQRDQNILVEEGGIRVRSFDVTVAVKTSLRALGAKLVDNDQTSMQAVRLVNRMVNALPPGGRVAMSVREELWKQTIRPEDLATAPPSAKELLQQAYDHCTYGAKHGLQPSMRHCLQSEHDAMLSKLNGTYWDAVKNGS